MQKKGWKAWVNDYLHFSKKERIGVLVLLAGILVIRLVPYYWPAAPAPPVAVPDSLIALLIQQKTFDSANRMQSGKAWNRKAFGSGENRPAGNSSFEQASGRDQPFKGKLFLFNPNLATATDWQQLGVPEKTIGTILKYREKGGRFRSAEDLFRIYGMPEQLAKRLLPMVRLESTPGSASGNTAQTAFREHSSGKPKKEDPVSRFKLVRINTADSLDWLALPGIGPKLSGRILSYRHALGGFVAREQIREVYGLADSVYQQLLPMLELDQLQVRKIPVNSATQEELGRHPYIRWKLAQAIIQYRTANGSLKGMEDLGKIHLIDDALLKKLGPYCEFQ
jgi:DNA uptake protein ComE-like DNA-binding protein